MARYRPSACWLLSSALVLVHCQKVCKALPEDAPQLYTYTVVKEYPHDSAAFTQGLLHDKSCPQDEDSCTDIFYESTGMNGESSVRVVGLQDGSVRQKRLLEHKWFGEGLAKLGSRLYQITWQTPHGFIYDVNTLEQVGEFETPLKDGWGITTDGQQLVLSDGSSQLTWVDPQTWQEARTITVTDAGRTIGFLNELEMVEGEVWANVWQTECIARIDPQSGRVKGWLLMHGLRSSLHHRNQRLAKGYIDVLNGIAYDPSTKRLWVTGKYWPSLYEIRAEPAHPHSRENKRKLQSCFVRS